MTISVAMTVNGKSVSGKVEARTLLVQFLREHLGMTGTHVGCDTSQCGACVVHVDGKSAKSCTMLAVQAECSKVLTIHGLAESGRYVDDLPLARATYAYFLRSPHAHAKIKSIDTAAAKKMPGVVEIFTGKDLVDAKVGGLICGWVVKDKHGQPHKAPPHPIMAADTVPYVADTWSIVVANSHDEAKDAAEAIQDDYDVKPAHVDLAKALGKTAPEV